MSGVGRVSRLLLVLPFVFGAYFASAAEGEVDEVVVTGSFIRGTPIDSESPVTILERGDLEAQGMPSIVELVRRLSASSGVDGESNQFQSNASEGVANVNLRGLGPARTLVLLNGKRQVPVPARLPAGRFVDVNAFPRQAIKRVEVLKEGAAATYGSDAIAGVVNFITRDDFQGFEMSAGFQDIDGSDGNEEYSAIFGTSVGGFDWVTSIGYETRSELSLRDIPNSQVSFAENPVGGFSSIGNPGVFFDPRDAGLAFAALPGLSPRAVKDPNCEALGGVDNSLFCRFRYTDFDNAIEEEKRYQLFSELNGAIAEGINLHTEILYSKVDTPEWKTSPSYPPQALFGDVQAVAADHPGLVDFASIHPEFQQYIDSGLGAVFYGRLVGVGASEGRSAKREYDTYRFAATLDGAFENGVGWDVGVSYSSSTGELEGVDARIGRTKLAFQGFGGNNCAGNLDTSGNLVTNGAVAGQGGCLYYNPFSNAIQTSNAEATQGAVNSDFNPAVANSTEVLAYLDDNSLNEAQTDLFVFDVVFQGDLFDGQAAWAGGYQYRDLSLKTDLDPLIDIAINPCQFEGQTTCTAPTGLRSFLAGSREVDDSQDVHSVFFETALDVSESIDIQLAVRYEDYGDSDTFDPKLAATWSVTDTLTIRGSVQTTFRGPDIDALNPNRVTALSFVGPTAAFKAIDVIGNPDIDPEAAFTYNTGAIFRPTESTTITLDYWSYDFDNPIIVEDFNALVGAYAAGGAAQEAIQSQIFCTGGTNDGSCPAGEIERIEVQTINGPSIETSGIDFYAGYFTDVGSGVLTLGVDASHTIEYEQEAYFKNGILVGDGYDGAGSLNAGRGARPIPDIKGRAFAEYNFDAHNFLLYVNYTSSYDDDRNAGIEIDSHTTIDLHYQLSLLEDDLRFTFSAINLADEEAPATRVDLGYDAYTHNPFGQMFKVGVIYRFGNG